MTDSLPSDKGTYADVRLAHLRALIKLVSSVGLRTPDYLRRRYNDVATHFDTTLKFLTAIGVVDDTPLGVELRVACDSSTDIETLIVEQIARTRGEARITLFEYLRLFRIVDGAPRCPAVGEEPLEYADVRNLLMELSVLSYDPSRSEHVLDHSHYALLLKAVRRVQVVSPEVVARQKMDLLDIGHRAELAVVAYERERLGPACAEKVVHVAATDAAAGYDIESRRQGASDEPRFIEVKAVRPADYRFYWTPNEVELAKSLGPWYSLYLVPVRHNSIALGHLKIVDDPARTIFTAGSTWRVESNVLECQMHFPDK